MQHWLVARIHGGRERRWGIEFYILKSRRVVFNIKGNDLRWVVAVAYRFGAVYIKFVGTHEQYDAIDANTVEMDSQAPCVNPRS